MDHCRNASEPDGVDDRLIEVPEPRDPDGDTADGNGSRRRGNDERMVHELDRRADELRQRHLQAALASLEERENLDEGDRAAIAACSRAIVDGVLRCPRRRLRVDEGDVAAVAANVFDLDN